MKKKINTKHKKNWNRLVQIIHTIYLDFMQEKNKQTTTTNYFMHTAKTNKQTTIYIILKIIA